VCKQASQACNSPSLKGSTQAPALITFVCVFVVSVCVCWA
jgi:hypothetical protein